MASAKGDAQRRVLVPPLTSLRTLWALFQPA